MDSMKCQGKKVYSASVTSNSHQLMVFKLVGKELKNNSRYKYLDKYIKRNYSELRIAAEKEAVKLYAHSNPITLNNIYDILSILTGLKDKDLEILIDLEEKIFLDKYKIDDIICQRIKEYNSQGYEILLIEDSYYTAKQIEKMLKNQDENYNDVKIYSSVDVKFSKQSGLIFAYIKEKESIEYNN